MAETEVDSPAQSPQNGAQPAAQPQSIPDKKGIAAWQTTVLAAVVGSGVVRNRLPDAADDRP